MRAILPRRDNPWDEDSLLWGALRLRMPAELLL